MAAETSSEREKKLEGRVKTLEKENSELTLRIFHLERENANLKKEVDMWKNK